MIKNEIISLNLKKQGILNLTIMQSMAYKLIYNNHHTILSSPTGTGKTLGYLIPLLDLLSQCAVGTTTVGTTTVGTTKNSTAKNDQDKSKSASPRVLILSPSQVLNSQILTSSIKIGHGIGLKCFMFPFIQGIPQRNYYTPDLLISTVGGLGSVKVKEFFSRTRTLVLDEADYLMNQKDTRKLLKQIPRNIQKVFIGATLTRTLDKIQKVVQDVQVLDYTSELRLVPSNITQIRLDTRDFIGKISLLLKETRDIGGKHLVFVNTVKAGEELFLNLRLQDSTNAVLLFNGDQTLQERLSTLCEFKGNLNTTILITTDLLSRGMDFKGVKGVWNFEDAKNYTDYVHRVGRTGRMGEQGFAYSFG